MITPEIISYIELEREKKISDSDIRSSLVASGWNIKDIDEAFSSLSTSVPQNATQPSKTKKTLTEFQNKRKSIIFFVYVVLDLIWTWITRTNIFLSKPNLSYSLFVFVFYLPIIYIAVYIVSRYVVPKEPPQYDKKWKGFAALIGNIIATGILLYVIVRVLSIVVVIGII